MADNDDDLVDYDEDEVGIIFSSFIVAYVTGLCVCGPTEGGV